METLGFHGFQKNPGTLGARMLLEAPGLTTINKDTTRNKKLLGAPSIFNISLRLEGSSPPAFRANNTTYFSFFFNNS